MLLNEAQRFPKELFTVWNPNGIVLETPWKYSFLKRQLNYSFLNRSPIMQAKDFAIFRSLLSDVHVKAFGEPISKIPHSKAHTLAWLIEEATGIVLSYKSLTNYINAVLEEAPDKVNPSCLTLATLAQFATGAQASKQMATLWFRYRAGLLAAA